MVADELEPQWLTSPADVALAAELEKQLGCPPAIAALLVSRGFDTASSAGEFLRPSLEDLHDPNQMLGLSAAVARIQQAVRLGEKILIYGDYDVDGTMATILLKTAIERTAPKNNPASVTWHVPHRIREGYGMQTNVLARAAADGVRLIISVDTGIRAFAAADEARSLGLDLIVTDHHLPDDATGVPDALAVINPAQSGCGYPFKSLCGAGVAFKLSHALLLAAATTPAEQERLNTIIVPSFLKLVALATIADSVPLLGENRTIAAIGLRELKNPVQAGLRALMEVAKLPLDQSPTAMEVGFRLAPRINAAGRMDVADDVIELFLTRDVRRAAELAQKLDELNQNRRSTEAEALEVIEAHLELLRGESGEFPADCIILCDARWHRGVLGILASRVVDRTGRPALILTHENGQAHGSGRSVQGFHLLDALTTTHTLADTADPVFTRFGGHAHAVGFSLPLTNLPMLQQRMSEHTRVALTVDILQPSLHRDLELALEEITPALWEWLQRCGPYGNSHEIPVFLTRGVTLAAPVRIIKERHICLEVTHGRHPARFSAMGWSRPGRRGDWGLRAEQMDLTEGTRIDIAYTITENRHPQYGGLQLQLVDLRMAL